METSSAPTEPEDKGSFPWGRPILWLCFLLMVYVLSIGPVAMLDDRGYLNSRAGQYLEMIYLPLFWAHDKTFLHKPLDVYVSLWTRRRGTVK